MSGLAGDDVPGCSCGVPHGAGASTDLAKWQSWTRLWRLRSRRGRYGKSLLQGAAAVSVAVWEAFLPAWAANSLAQGSGSESLSEVVAMSARSLGSWPGLSIVGDGGGGVLNIKDSNPVFLLLTTCPLAKYT